MGRIDAPPPRRPAPHGISPAGWIVAGVLAAIVLALGAHQLGSRRRPAPVPAAGPPMAPTVPASQPHEAELLIPTAASAPTAEPPAERLERAVFEVTIPRPSPTTVGAQPPDSTPTPEARETLHDQMARCLVFGAEREMDAWHPYVLQLRVQAKNHCDVAFVGDEVWFEVRAVLPSTQGTAARETGRFQEPIPARGRAETHIAMPTLDPSGFGRGGLYSFETKLWWASGGGRNASE